MAGGAPRVSLAVSDPAPGGPPDREKAFRELVVPEVDVLLRVALSITRSAPDAEDLVQDTLLRAYRSMSSFDGRHPRAWLLTILRNAQINRTRRQRPALLDDPDEVVRRLSVDDDARSDPETVLMDRLLDQHLDAALRALPERFRLPIELVDVDELGYEEAAALLGVPIGTLTSRLSRGRKRLRAHLERAGALRRRTRT
jgi:RNA polymerase sigma-70 factor (ECF subfamily)